MKAPSRCPECGAPCYIHKDHYGLIDQRGYIKPHDLNYPDKYLPLDVVVKMLDEWLNQCTCSIEYTSRELRDPQCERCNFDLDAFVEQKLGASDG